MDTDEIEKAVEERRDWLQGQLEAAAPRFGVELVGEVVNTYDMRSASAIAREGDHDVWLRVVVEDRDYQPACRWDGNVEANSMWYTINGAQAHFGAELPEEIFAGIEWTTAPADLHWGNLRGRELCVLDWESWRPAPAGYDAATLYCTSLLHPPTARRLRAMPVFETRTDRAPVRHCPIPVGRGRGRRHRPARRAASCGRR